MGVTIDKSRGNTVVQRVSIKSVTEGGSAALAKSSRGVGLKLGMYKVVDMILVYPKARLTTATETCGSTSQGFHTNGRCIVKVFILADVFHIAAAYSSVCNLRDCIC